MKLKEQGAIWRIVISIAVGILVFWLATTIFQNLRIGGVLFNCGLILAVCAALLFGRASAFSAVITYAVLVDLYASRFMGINLAIYSLITYLASISRDELYAESVSLPLFLLAGGSLMYDALYGIIMLPFSYALPFMSFLRIAAIGAIYNLVLGYVLYRILFRIVKGYRLGREHV